MWRQNRWCWGLAVGVLLACGGDRAASKSAPFAITNPTGACTAEDNGARRGYHSPARGDVWLPDCELPLEREYWRVFAVSATSAYVMPRPDGAPALAAVCADSEHELHALVEKYALCEPATGATVELVNDLSPADALALTNYLHRSLRFEVVPGGLSPFPIPTDIVDACLLAPQENSQAFVELCEREQERLESGNELGFTYEGPAAEELALRLNELYGVTAVSCDERLSEAGQRISALLESVERACETDEDCALVSTELPCLPSCGGVFVAAAAADDFTADVGRVVTSVCGPFLDAGCEPPAPSSCPPSGREHGCISGRCQ